MLSKIGHVFLIFICSFLNVEMFFAYSLSFPVLRDALDLGNMFFLLFSSL